MARTPLFTSSEDRHLIFNATHRLLKCFKSDGTLEWHMEARGEGTAGDSSRTFGNTPPGLYKVDQVERLTPGSENKAYGPFRIALIPVQLDKGRNRKGLYIHGGALTYLNHSRRSRDGRKLTDASEFRTRTWA
jgi:hypothetical protein